LLALHYTTKEIPEWVWSTFWWHDRPDDGPYAMNRPPAVSGVWRHYLMSTAFSMEAPKEGDGKPHVTFNPWLEARFVNGTVSNCMTCHRQSVWPLPDHGNEPPFLPVTRGTIGANDPNYFKGNTKLDFLWSVGFESQ
jgi:hypothetical protein